MDATLGNTLFDDAGQSWFAVLSGDHNPIHVDPIAVRRTLPARLVVHGVHVLLWAIGVFAAASDGEIASSPIARVRVRFLRFTHVGDRIELVVIARDRDKARLEVRCEDVVRAEIRLAFGGPDERPASAPQAGNVFAPGVGPLDRLPGSFDGLVGRVAFMAPPGALAARFPAAAAWVGARRIDALAAATRLVGMVCPGLRSVLGGLDLRFVPDAPGDALAFRMGDWRHGQVSADVTGGGIDGTLDARTPAPPVAQPPSAALRALLAPDAFAGVQALVVGGSCGVGEVAAKLLALGGADVTLTWRDGEDDAVAVAEDIARAGGVCEITRYDTAIGADAQLGERAPTHAVWCATPTMAAPASRLVDERRLAAARAVFVTGLHAFATALHRRRPDVALLIPSTVWIDAPPPGLAEYVMAKAAAEVLARTLGDALAPARFATPRLPPMATDQTARLGLLEPAPVAETILPHLKRFVTITQ